MVLLLQHSNVLLKGEGGRGSLFWICIQSVDNMMPFVFFLIGMFSSFFWYWILRYLLEDGGIEVISLTSPLEEHLYLGLISASLSLGLTLCFRIMKTIRRTIASHHRRLAWSLIAIGLNLSLLLRSVLVIRINLEENVLYGLERLALDDVALFAWGTGGGVAGLCMGCGLSIAFTLLKE